MNNSNHLQKALKPIHLWGIAVGMVISGQYFGWNYGFEQGGTIGLAIAAIIVTIFYTTFILAIQNFLHPFHTLEDHPPMQEKRWVLTWGL